MQGLTPYQDGYNDGRYGSESTGWPIEQPPTEKTVVEFIYTAGQIVQDKSIDPENLAWLAGLLTGWFDRSRKS